MTVLFLVYCTASWLVQLMKQQNHPVRTSVLCLMSALVTLMLSTFRRFCTEANLDLQAAADDLGMLQLWCFRLSAKTLIAMHGRTALYRI